MYERLLANQVRSSPCYWRIRYVADRASSAMSRDSASAYIPLPLVLFSTRLWIPRRVAMSRRRLLLWEAVFGKFGTRMNEPDHCSQVGGASCISAWPRAWQWLRHRLIGLWQIGYVSGSEVHRRSPVGVSRFRMILAKSVRLILSSITASRVLPTAHRSRRIHVVTR
jgi:hypothetical protein